jgi:hypothetical protein
MSVLHVWIPVLHLHRLHFPLSSDSPLVESQLISLEYVTINSPALPWSAGDNSIQSSSFELPL